MSEPIRKWQHIYDCETGKGIGNNPADRTGLSILGVFLDTLWGRVLAGIGVLLLSAFTATRTAVDDRFRGADGVAMEERIMEEVRQNHNDIRFLLSYKAADEIAIKGLQEYVRTHELAADGYKKIITQGQIQIGECFRRVDRLEGHVERLERK